MPPLKPMLAKAATTVPEQAVDADGDVWLYEPKWDGFRCLLFRDGDEVVLGSRNERDLGRYFPELLAAAQTEVAPRCVIDGEIVVPRNGGEVTRLDWESLSQRIHPAASRVDMLAEQTPAQFVAFDCLALGDVDLMALPLRDRRIGLKDALAGAGTSIHVSTSSGDAAVAADWFDRFEGAGLDGVIAKRLAGPYRPDTRDMVKVKHHRTADCIVIGYRPHKSIDGAIGSLLLGLHGDTRMHMVGGASAFTVARRKELLEMLQEYRDGDARPGEPNRWAQREDHSFFPLRPELVCEVEYDQMEGDRFRHAARFLRWRTDKDAEDCTYDQLEVPVRYDFADVLAGH